MKMNFDVRVARFYLSSLFFFLTLAPSLLSFSHSSSLFLPNQNKCCSAHVSREAGVRLGELELLRLGRFLGGCGSGLRSDGGGAGAPGGGESPREGLWA